MEIIYCLKCRCRREIENAHLTTMSSGKTAYEGNCPVCTRKVFKFSAKK